jgi:branched-chain amino acid transport system ATP-binding protein
MDPSPILKTVKLSSGYGKSLIVDDVSLHVNEGEIVAIIGPNGSGKSTLLKTIIGILRPFDGEIRFMNEDITHMLLHHLIRKGVGYVPQIENVFTELTVEENLEMGGYILKGGDLRTRLKEAFSTFPELAPLEGRKAETLSGGERQMLALARGLMTGPCLLILDEPTSNLDPKAVSMFYSKIEEINASGVSIIMAEQNVKGAMGISDRAYVLVSGRLIFEGDVEDVTSLDLRKMFFQYKSRTLSGVFGNGV